MVLPEIERTPDRVQILEIEQAYNADLHPIEVAATLDLQDRQEALATQDHHVRIGLLDIQGLRAPQEAQDSLDHLEALEVQECALVAAVEEVLAVAAEEVADEEEDNKTIISLTIQSKSEPRMSQLLLQMVIGSF